MHEFNMIFPTVVVDKDIKINNVIENFSFAKLPVCYIHVTVYNQSIFCVYYPILFLLTIPGHGIEQKPSGNQTHSIPWKN